jgi:hypothetical protein
VGIGICDSNTTPPDLGNAGPGLLLTLAIVFVKTFASLASLGRVNGIPGQPRSRVNPGGLMIESRDYPDLAPVHPALIPWESGRSPEMGQQGKGLFISPEWSLCSLVLPYICLMVSAFRKTTISSRPVSEDCPGFPGT